MLPATPILPVNLRQVLVVAVLALTAASTAASARASAPTASPKPPPAVFGLGPASAKAVDGRPYYYFLAQPGSSLSDHVAIVNIGLETLTLSVYTTDASNAPDGSFSFTTAAQRPEDVGAWVHMQIPGGGDKVVVKGRSKVILPVSMTVPANASPGDHAGALVASLQGQVRGSNGELIHLDQRVATRVFVRISGPLHPRLAVENLRATYRGSLNPFGKGAVTVSYVVHNTGNVKLGGIQHVSVRGLLGSVAASNEPQVPLLLPGGSVQESIVVNGVLPQLWMSATVTVQPAGLTGDVNPSSATVTATTHFWAFPPWLLLVLLILIVLGLLWYERHRRGRQSSGEGGKDGSSDRPDPSGPKSPSTEREQDQVSA
jgi:hypothetical protein